MPAALWLVRHGESAANLARHAAYAANRAEIELETRDADVPLSPRGERQAVALGRWLAGRPLAEQPTVVLTSPYRRALDTARLVVGAGGTARGPAFSAQDLVVDERLREKELGQFYRLTRLGVEQRHPDQWALRREVGPFYYRPPGGESWCDVVLRLRSVLDSVALHYRDERVMMVCHQIVIYCARYVLEGFGEDEVLRVAREHDVANCSVTMYDPADSGAAGIRGRFALARFNVTVPVEEEGGAVTVEPEAAGSA